MPFFPYLPPGTSSSTREADHVKRIEEGERGRRRARGGGKGRMNPLYLLSSFRRVLTTGGGSKTSWNLSTRIAKVWP